MKSQLYRSQKNKMLGGVAGGLAEYFDVDPVIIRVIFFVSVFAWGLSILVYIALWIFVPVDENDYEPIQSEFDPDNQVYEDLGVNIKSDKQTQRKIIAGMILIVFGIVIILDKFIPEVDMSHIWPIVLVGLGAYIIYKASKNKSI